MSHSWSQYFFFSQFNYIIGQKLLFTTKPYFEDRTKVGGLSSYSCNISNIIEPNDGLISVREMKIAGQLDSYGWLTCITFVSFRRYINNFAFCGNLRDNVQDFESLKDYI